VPIDCLRQLMAPERRAEGDAYIRRQFLENGSI
jgi:hypothetical protein